jgi:hypothetical protein
LPLAEFAYNNGVHSGSNQSPFYACYGFHPQFAVRDTTDQRVPAADEHAEFLKKGYEEAKAALTIAQENMAKYYDQRHHSTTKFSLGDKAWLDAKNIQMEQPSRKLSHKCLGPFKVIEQVGKSSYRLKLPGSMKVHPVFHVSLLYPHPTNDFNQQLIPPPPVVTPEGEEEYKVEKIINSQKISCKVEYGVRWKGYRPEEDTWEPKENLANAQDALKDFFQAHLDAPWA